MFQKHAQRWILIYSCMILAAVGFFISLHLVLSLTSFYFINRSEEIFGTIRSVYTVNNLTFTIDDSTHGKQSRTPNSSLIPTLNTIESIQEQLNNLFDEVNGRVIVSSATIISTKTLILTLKIYFVRECFACESIIQQNIIKQILKQKLAIQVYVEYSQNCVLDTIQENLTTITLDDDISNTSQISRAIQTPIGSLVQQMDICANQTAQIYPTNCTRTKASGTVTIINVKNGTLGHLCYYFIPPASSSNIKLEFIFSNIYWHSYFGVDDITLHSTSNLITNGDFETKLEDSIEDPWYPWSISVCEKYCDAGISSDSEIEDSQFFHSSGIDVILSQTVAINTVGRQFVHRLEFWLGYISNMNLSGSLIITLTTT